jgi:hypothetical protein
VILAILGVTIWICLSQMVRLDLLQYTGVLLLVIVLSVALFAFFGFRALVQLQKVWESIEIEIGDQYIVRRQINVEETRIERGEVVAVQESEKGLLVSTMNNSRSLFIPVQLEEQGYEEVRATLSAWVPVQEASAPRMRRGVLVAVLYVLGYVFVLLSWSRWLTLFVSLAMVAGLAYLRWLRRDNKQAASQLKGLSAQTAVFLVVMTAIKFTPVFQEYRLFVRSLFFLYE